MYGNKVQADLVDRLRQLRRQAPWIRYDNDLKMEKMMRPVVEDLIAADPETRSTIIREMECQFDLHQAIAWAIVLGLFKKKPGARVAAIDTLAEFGRTAVGMIQAVQTDLATQAKQPILLEALRGVVAKLDAWIVGKVYHSYRAMEEMNKATEAAEVARRSVEAIAAVLKAQDQEHLIAAYFLARFGGVSRVEKELFPLATAGIKEYPDAGFLACPIF